MALVEIRGVGSCTGDVIVLAAQRLVRKALCLTLTPGIVFKSQSPGVQDLVAGRIKGECVGESFYAPSNEIRLTDDRKHSYVVEAYCVNFEKANPGEMDTFSFGLIDARSQRIILAGQKVGLSMEAIQSALWIALEGITDEQIKGRVPVSNEDIKAARGLLRDVSERR